MGESAAMSFPSSAQIRRSSLHFYCNIFIKKVNIFSSESLFCTKSCSVFCKKPLSTLHTIAAIAESLPPSRGRSTIWGAGTNITRCGLPMETHVMRSHSSSASSGPPFGAAAVFCPAGPETEPNPFFYRSKYCSRSAPTET